MTHMCNGKELPMEKNITHLPDSFETISPCNKRLFKELKHFCIPVQRKRTMLIITGAALLMAIINLLFGMDGSNLLSYALFSVPLLYSIQILTLKAQFQRQGLQLLTQDFGGPVCHQRTAFYPFGALVTTLESSTTMTFAYLDIMRLCEGKQYLFLLCDGERFVAVNKTQLSSDRQAELKKILVERCINLK